MNPITRQSEDAAAWRAAAEAAEKARARADALHREATIPLVAQAMHAFLDEHEHVAALTLCAEHDRDHGHCFLTLSGGAVLADGAPQDATGDHEALELFENLQRDVRNDVLLALFEIDDVGDGTLAREQIMALQTTLEAPSPRGPRDVSELITHLQTIPGDTPVTRRDHDATPETSPSEGRVTFEGLEVCITRASTPDGALLVFVDGPDAGACHDDCQHPQLDHAAHGEPCRRGTGEPLPRPDVNPDGSPAIRILLNDDAVYEGRAFAPETTDE